MKLKIILGIIVPLLLIIFLVLLGSIGPGFEVKNKFDDSIGYKEIFKKDYNANAVRVGEITVKNDYFLPKRFEAPSFLVCAKDSQNKRPLKSVGAVFYNEGEYSESVKYTGLDSIQYASKSSMDYYGYNYNYRNYKTNVEIDSNGVKKLQVYFSSNQYYNSYNNDYSNPDYDELILVEQKPNGRLNCEGLSSEDMEKSIKIIIDKGKMNPGNCPESGLSGAIGKAISFDGFDDYISGSVGNQKTFYSNKMTISFWMNQKEIVEGENLGLVSLDSSSYGSKSIIQFAKLNGENHLFTDAINIANNLVLSQDKMPVLNQWNHVIFIIDDQNYSYYLNGKPMLTGKFNNYLSSSINNIQIGRRSDQATGYYTGLIDELVIWGRVLSADEILNMYNKAGEDVEENAFVVYHFDEDKNVTSFSDSKFDLGMNLNCFNEVIYAGTIMQVQ